MMVSTEVPNTFTPYLARTPFWWQDGEDEEILGERENSEALEWWERQRESEGQEKEERERETDEIPHLSARVQHHS